jgi:hypothetical protein
MPMRLDVMVHSVQPAHPPLPMQTVKSPRRAWLFALLFVGALPTQAQTGIVFGNLAPRDGDAGGRLSLWVDGAPHATEVGYGELVDPLPLPAGVRQLALVDERGEVLLQREARLLADRGYTVYAAGDGLERPLQLRIARESAQPLDPARTALQVYSAALHPSDPLRFELRCGLIDSSGSLTFGREEIPRGFLPADGLGCDFRVLDPGAGGGVLATTQFLPAPGVLVRVVLDGDGVRQPYRVRAFEASQRARARVVPDAGMEGLWFDPSDDGSGLTVLVEPGAGDERIITGVFYGFLQSGAPTWVLLEGVANRPADLVQMRGMRVLESVGGRPLGDRQPVRMQLGIASLDFHSCREATLFLFATSERMPQRLGREPGDGPQQAFRLQRLLPIDACLTGAGAAGSGRR